MSVNHIAGLLRPRPQGAPVVTWNPSDAHASIGFYNGNYRVNKASLSAWVSARANVGKSTGKHYFEVCFNKYSFAAAGLANNDPAVLNSYGGFDTNSFVWYNTGAYTHNNIDTANAISNAFQTMDSVCVAVDLDAKLMWARRNNTGWNTHLSGTPDPATGIGGIAIPSTMLGTLYPVVSVQNSGSGIGDADTSHGRFQLADFSFIPPSGFAAWDTNVSTLISASRWRFNFLQRFGSEIWVNELYMRTLPDQVGGNPQQQAIEGLTGTASATPVAQSGYEVPFAFNRGSGGNGYAPTGSFPNNVEFTFNKSVVIREAEIWAVIAATKAPSEMNFQYYDGSSWQTLQYRLLVVGDYVSDRYKFSVQ